ncbi:MAG: hypothetical protein ABR579_09745 [Actinomycetota bacterium]
MLNRGALILRYKQPFVDWINAVDPAPGSHILTLSEAAEDPTVYLVEVEDEAGVNLWLRINHRPLFEDELAGWYTDSNLWPRDRSLEALRAWCDIEFHSEVIDTGNFPLIDDRPR